jgi:hypothetical protein
MARLNDQSSVGALRCGIGWTPALAAGASVAPLRLAHRLFSAPEQFVASTNNAEKLSSLRYGRPIDQKRYDNVWPTSTHGLIGVS